MGDKLRIGIMGGTFNPIHTGHLLLAEAALTEEHLDRIMFLPNDNPYKDRSVDFADGAQRLEMVRRAVAGHPDFFVSDMELVREGVSYTCDTLRELETKNPGTEYFFLVGSDCLFSIEKWRNPEEIFARCTLLGAVRGEGRADTERQCEMLRAKYGAKIRLIPFCETAISSTEIRERVKEKRSIRYMVPDSVRDYIEEQGLYGG